MSNSNDRMGGSAPVGAPKGAVTLLAFPCLFLAAVNTTHGDNSRLVPAISCTKSRPDSIALDSHGHSPPSPEERRREREREREEACTRQSALRPFQLPLLCGVLKRTVCCCWSCWLARTPFSRLFRYIPTTQPRILSLSCLLYFSRRLFSWSVYVLVSVRVRPVCVRVSLTDCVCVCFPLVAPKVWVIGTPHLSRSASEHPPSCVCVQLGFFSLPFKVQPKRPIAILLIRTFSYRPCFSNCSLESNQS